VTLSSSTRVLVQEMLLPGERIDYLFPALIPLRPRGNVLLAVTPRSITVFATRGRSGDRPTSVLARYSRRTRVGPVDLHGIASFTLGGIVYEVDDEYVAVVNALDAERAGADVALPPDPWPEL
jgi:hypothetical protein